MTLVKTIIRDCLREDGEPLNILSFPTHERYQENMAKTGHNFYLWQAEGIKPWVESYAKVPPNTVLLNPEKGTNQFPIEVDINLVLSQNKFGQFDIASQIASQISVPLLSIEHTLPMKSWSNLDLNKLYNMRGDLNLFISSYSREKWGWKEDEADVIHHGVDTNLFSPSYNVVREPRVLSVVNDWINRDWCCGYRLWEEITGFPETPLPLHVVGDTPGLSQSSPTTEHLVNQYRKSRIFLNTSLISPVPTALLEAMSCGCAIVTTENCMIPEIIVNGKNGFMSNDPKKLREHVENLLEDESLAQEIGSNARKTVIEKFSIEQFVENWNKIFDFCMR